jgi:hypothetical protein
LKIGSDRFCRFPSKTGIKFKTLKILNKPNQIPVNRSVLLIYRTGFESVLRLAVPKNLEKSIKIMHIVVIDLFIL